MQIRPFLTLLLVAPAAAQVNQLRSSHSIEGLVTNEIIVEIAPSGSLPALLAGTELEVAACLDGANLFLLTVPEQYDLAQRCQVLGAAHTSNESAYAEFNRIAQPPELPGCNPTQGPGTVSCTIAFFDGQPTPARYFEQDALGAIQLGELREELDDETTVVAVIDTGIDPSHEVFQDRLFSLGHDVLNDTPGAFDMADGLDNDGDTFVDEGFGHGTHVAGTIVLIDPNARILPLRVLDSDGNGTAAGVARAIHLALADDVSFINLSLSMSWPSLAVAQALDLAAQQGVAVYSSAGNTGRYGVSFPASHPHVVAVAATDVLDGRAAFSSYGPLVDLSAPGVDIYSAMPGDSWAWWSGTSMATAVATGSAALLHSIEPELLPVIELALIEGAEDLDPINPGYAGLLGAGRIDVEEAARILEEEEE